MQSSQSCDCPASQMREAGIRTVQGVRRRRPSKQSKKNKTGSRGAIQRWYRIVSTVPDNEDESAMMERRHERLVGAWPQ